MKDEDVKVDKWTPTEPTLLDLVRELREAAGLFSGAMPITPQEAWREAITRVRAALAHPTAPDSERALLLAVVEVAMSEHACPDYDECVRPLCKALAALHAAHPALGRPSQGEGEVSS